ncbi:MAG: IS4 family transposase [Nevskiales bacterium]
MHETTRFFPPFGPLLFGRAPRSITEKLRNQAARLDALSQLQVAFGSLIPAHRLAPSAQGPNSRLRVFSPSVTFWAFLAQVLSPPCACRQIVRKVQAWWAERGQPHLCADTSAYCQARARLPLATLEAIHDDLVTQLQRSVSTEQHWRGRTVKIVDGTNVSMPDTAANQAAYPQQASQQPGCGFPMMKVVGVFCLASGALLQIVRGTLRVHDCQLFRQLWRFLARGDILLADRGFCSYAAIASLAARGVDCVMRLHQARPHDARRGRRLGPRDRLLTWTKPIQRTPAWSAEDFAALSETLTVRLVHVAVGVRGFRTRQFVLVTTLLDRLAYPAEALGQLYFQRWTVELHFREIKILLGLDVLRCQSPAMIHKELQLHLIAYNLVRALMQQAAARHHVPLARLSFKGALDTMRQWADVLHAARGQPRKQAALRRAMLALIARDQLPHRPGRSEPRAKKRRPKNYHLLTAPRHQMRVPAHRNRPRKSSQNALN